MEKPNTEIGWNQLRYDVRTYTAQNERNRRGGEAGRIPAGYKYIGDKCFLNNGKVHDIFFNNIEIEPDSDGTGSEEFAIGRELNPFIESDKKLEDMNLSALQLTCHVSRIVYSDGSTLELKTSLN